MPRSIAARATSSPTWRPKRSRISSRSRSPAPILLKPAWRSPSSEPSKTGTSASRSPCSTFRSARRTDTTGAAVCRADCQVTSSPTITATPASAIVVIAISFAEMSRPESSSSATSSSPISGTPEPSAQASIARSVTPGSSGLSGTP